MNVWIDGSAFESRRQYGIWRVFYELISRSADAIDYTIWLRDRPRQPLPENVRVYQDLGRATASRFNLPARARRRMANSADPHPLAHADAFHSTGFTFPKNDAIPTVITVYDLIPESHFSMCIREVEEGIPTRRLAFERATALPCISQATAKEFAAFYPQLAEKTSVIHLGCEHLAGNQTPNSLRNKPVVLYVGQRGGYKNFFSVLHAMTHAEWPVDVGLDVAGPPLSDAELRLIDRLGLQSRIESFPHVTDQSLRQHYQQSLGLIFPSYQEGFGLPCLEAHTLECPLLCSDIPVFREVAGEAALFFDPYSAEMIASCVRRIKDGALRERLIELGRQNSLRFSWNESARRLVELYQGLGT